MAELVQTLVERMMKRVEELMELVGLQAVLFVRVVVMSSKRSGLGVTAVEEGVVMEVVAVEMEEVVVMVTVVGAVVV